MKNNDEAKVVVAVERFLKALEPWLLQLSDNRDELHLRVERHKAAEELVAIAKWLDDE